MVPGVLPPSSMFLSSLNTTDPAVLFAYQPLCEERMITLKRLIGRTLRRWSQIKSQNVVFIGRRQMRWTAGVTVRSISCL
jgi:hypothetical protein